MAYRDTSVGTDTVNYETIFLYLQLGSDWLRGSVEPSFVILNDLVSSLGGDFIAFLITSSLLILILIFYAARRYSYNPMLTIFLYYSLYFYFYAFNILRQSIAVAISLIAINYLIKQKHILYCLLILLAASFHYSALVMLPLLLVSRLPINKALMIALVFFAMALGLFGTPIFLKTISLIGYGSYVNEYEIGSFFGNFLNLILFNLFFTYIVLTINHKNIYLQLFFLFIVLFNLTARIPFGNRLLLYLSIYQILFIPYYLGHIRDPKKYKIISIIFIVILSYFTFFRVFGAGEIIPYTNTLLQ